MNPDLFRYIWTHSRRDQIVILAVVLASLPTYFASFDVPKKIINDAIQGKAFVNSQTATFLRLEFGLPQAFGGATIRLFDGFQLTQLSYLWALCALFLTLVIVNGAFKYQINYSKGVLGERMLRRMRYEMFSLFLRFRPEDLRTVKPAEAATIIKDEIETVGGFVGDAFVQPTFLAAQALTALLFIMAQSFWLGLVALVVVLAQAVVIPRLRREQLRLSRERQIASRKLAGRVGEVVETAMTLHALGASAYTRADIAERLGVLFKIRVDLFNRKFAVKFLNNLMAQITPFFFYAIGGYLALTGRLDIGQLVAVIAAYRDLPPPIKELIDWDQQRADAVVKWQQVLSQFPSRLLGESGPSAEETRAALGSGAPIELRQVKAVDGSGAPLLDSTTLSIARPSHVALVGPSSGRDVVAGVIGRQVYDVSGRAGIGGVSLFDMTDEVGADVAGYVGPEPHLVSGSIRDNLLAGLRRHPPELSDADVDRIERLRRLEATRTGNPLATPSDRWLDLARLGAEDPAALDARAFAVLADLGLGDELMRLGLLGKLDPKRDARVVAAIPELRRAVGAALADKRVGRLVEQFDIGRYNRNACIGENLLFGAPIGERLSSSQLGRDPYVRSILEAEALLYPLTSIGLRMAQGVIEIFADLPPGSPLFERFSFIGAEDMPVFERIAEQARLDGLGNLSPDAQARLVELALSYDETRHRMDVLDPAFEARVVRARGSLRTYLPQSYHDAIEFYDADKPILAASILDNVLFGRIGYGVANAETKVADLVRGAMRAHGVESVLFARGLAHDVGPGGRQLQPRQRALLALARGLLARPDTLVVDRALAALTGSEARAILARLRTERDGLTLVVTCDDIGQAAGFDAIHVFEGPRLVSTETPAPARAAAN